MDIKQLVRTAGRTLQHNTPGILTGMGVVGVVTTAALAVKATPKATTDIRMVAEDNDMLPSEMKKIEVVKVVWKHYVPATLVGAATIACIIGANSVNTRRNAALVATYTLAERAFREYREEVTESLGKDKEKAISDKADQRKVERPDDVRQVIIDDINGGALVLDSLTGRFFMSDVEVIRRAENDITRQLLEENYASMNDFFSLIGLPATKLGEEMGWRSNHMLEIRFSSHLTKSNKPCLVIDYERWPLYNFWRNDATML